MNFGISQSNERDFSVYEPERPFLTSLFASFVSTPVSLEVKLPIKHVRPRFNNDDERDRAYAHRWTRAIAGTKT